MQIHSRCFSMIFRYGLGIVALSSMCFMFLLSGCGGNQANIERKEQFYYSKSGVIRIIKVLPGDTISKISSEYSVPTVVIANMNNLNVPYTVRVGQTLRIPLEKFHKVKKGQSIVDISRLYGVSIPSLVVINDLKTPYILKEGSFIKIPNSKIIRYEDQDIKLDIKESKNPEAAEVQPTVYSESLMEESQNGHQFSRGISSKITPEIESDNVQNIDESDKKTSDQFADNKMLDKIHQEEEERNKATSTEGNPVADNKKFYCKTPLDLPEFVWPLRGTIATRYGKNGNHFSEGINILAPLGTHIVAAGAGEVIYVGNQVKGYGNLIIIRHENDFLTAYAHTKDVFVKKGDKVSRGQKIATVGKTGNVDKEQLQFSVRHGKKTVNPDAPY